MKLFKIYFFLLFLIVSPGFLIAQEGDKWTLQECIKYALDNNLNVQREKLNTLNIDANLMEGRGNRIPSFSTGAQTGFRWGRSINPFTNLFETQRIGNVNLFANSNYTIYAGRQITNNINRSKLDLRANEMDIKFRANEVSIDIITLFVNVIFAVEQLKIAERQFNTTQDQLERIVKLVDAGVLPLADKLDLQSQLATNEVEVINADNNLRIARLNLQQAMQKPFDENFLIEIPDLDIDEYSIPESNSESIFRIAMEIMPEIQSADLRIESARKGVDVAKGGFYPTLGLNSNAFSNYVDIARDPLSPTGEYIFTDQVRDNISVAANISLNIPIFSNFSNKANLQRALVQKDLEEINKLESKNFLRQNIETSFTNARAAYMTYNSTIKRVEALRESFRMATERFNLGAINFVDFQLAQTNFFNAEADLINAKYEYILRTKILDFYLGNPLSLD